MKITFAGTNDFGIPTLEALKNDYELDLIITKVGSPIESWAKKNNITTTYNLQPTTSDLLLVIAYGKKIPKGILDALKFGSINVHGSLLPKYRGPSPIQAALLNGDKQTGITLIQMDEEIDHGPIIASKKVSIDPKDNFLSLYKKLSEESADLVAQTLPKWFTGTIQAKEQDHSQATFAKLLTKADGRIQWTKNAQEILNQIRALNPEPGTWTTLDGKLVKILDASIAEKNKIELPGKLLRLGQDLGVKCGDYNLRIFKIQPEGKQPMSSKDFLNGLRNLENKIFL